MKNPTSKRRPPARHIGLMLRTCVADMTAYGGFVWPTSGFVAAPDWHDRAECGGGLHGCVWGEGDPTSAWRWEDDARWLVCEVDLRQVVEIGGKVKVPRAWVVYCGDRDGATRYLLERAHGRAVIGASVTAGYRGTATAGYRGTATAGYRGTATAGYRGTATAGDDGEIRICWHDGTRYRLTVGYVGEGGIKPNVAYRCDERGRLVPA